MFRSFLRFKIYIYILSLCCAPALSGDCPTQRLSKYLPTLPPTHNIAVFVGAMARGRDDFADAYVDEKISISEYSLSASVACGKVFFFIVRPPIFGQLLTIYFFFSLSFAVRWKNSGTSSDNNNPFPIFLHICAIIFAFLIRLFVVSYIMPKWFSFFFFNKKKKGQSQSQPPKSALQLAEKKGNCNA